MHFFSSFCCCCCSFFHHFLLLLMISCSKKKMCFIYRAQLMEVLLYLLAGNYVSLLNSALCCKHGYVFLCCSMACWLRPNALRSICNPQCCILPITFVANGSLCFFLICFYHYPAHLRKLHCNVAECIESSVMTQSLGQR